VGCEDTHCDDWRSTASHATRRLSPPCVPARDIESGPVPGHRQRPVARELVPRVGERKRSPSVSIHCEFMPTGNRWLIPNVRFWRSSLDFAGQAWRSACSAGSSASKFCATTRERWYTHLHVGAWATFNTSCNQALALVKRNHKGTVGDKQCRFSQSKFDAIFEEVRGLFTKRYAHRILIQRNLSERAAATVARQSLDFQYIDARHDYEGVLEDLRAWWPKLCPGGLMAGHYYDNVNGMPMARTVGEFVRSLGPSSDGSKPTVFITSDHPPSWLSFGRRGPVRRLAPKVTAEGS
jgi:hypothetical protein